MIDKVKTLAEVGKLVAETFHIFRFSSKEDERDRRLKELERQVADLKKEKP